MVQGQDRQLKIGAVARLAGVSVDTVRYYERRGLLRPAERLPSGYRLYTAGAVNRIALARRLQSLGMTLDEIAAALSAHGDDAACDAQRWRLEKARGRVVTELARLAAVRTELDAALARCAEGRCDLRAEG